MKRAKKKMVLKRKPTPPRKMRTDDLCKALCSIAAFQIESSETQLKLYEAVRRLQALDAAAIQAGILPR